MTEPTEVKRPISLLICALGGEGGGVLVEWLVRTATASGFAVQSTSIPGVAQRTGATTYYIEIFPVPIAELGGKKPVFSLYPVPGALDVLVSSELLETVRQIGAGMVSPDRTHVLTSTSRTLTTIEKMQLSDGRVSTSDLLKTVSKFSLDCHASDMSAIARENGTVVSAVLMGAIAGSGLLPFPREAFEATVRQSNRGVEASLRGFAHAFDTIHSGAAADATHGESAGETPLKLPAHAMSIFPESVTEMATLGYARLVEYQDRQYADLYSSRLERILQAERAADSDGAGDWAVTRETARYLALWMAFDDIVRVADLKCRQSRAARVRREVKAGPDEIVRVYDFFKPGIPEIAALLPTRLADGLVRWDKRRVSAGKSPFAFPLKVGTHTLTGFAALRFLASLGWLRKRSSRYAKEQEMIERWLSGIEQGIRGHWQVGYEIAQCGRLIKGYGTTNERGKENLLHVLDYLSTAAFDSELARAEAIGAARASALADDSGKALDQTLISHGAPAMPVKAQPIVWMKKPRQSASQ
jgi:indolepyruvate ferredoxin oxidoreductase beta subunit